MTSRAPHSNAAAAPVRLRTLLRAGTALCGIATLALAAGVARASILPTQLSTNLAVAGAGSVNTKVLTNGAVVPATVNYTSNGAAAIITLVAPRTLIDWTTFEVGGGSSLGFAFTNAASDIVLNRVMGGTPGTNTITVDAGGAVHGTFGGAVGGNIWFLAPDGVFINGTVTASGVLATNNTTVADLNLLSDAAATLKGELAAGASLIDLSGITAASGATIDASGNLFLTGPETVTGDVMLESTGALAINAKIVAEGAVPVTVAYTSDSPLNFSLAAGATLTFANADGSPATSSAGGSLTINGQPYTLLYKLANPGSTGPDTGLDDIAGIDANVAAGGDGGLYALATNLTGTGTAASPQFASALVGQGSNAFSGVFEGLGHTITGLTINDSVSGTPTGTNENVGLFGFSIGAVRDLGLIGGSVTGANLAYVGALAGVDAGTIIQDYATSAVSGGQDGDLGGLVGANLTGTITRSYATGPVTGAGASAAGSAVAGGLVGANAGVITQAYATGAVSGGPNMDLGGLVGGNSGSITQTYATGAVSGSGAVITGGLVGFNSGPGPTGGGAGVITSGAFDIQTTGQPFGIGQDQNNQAGNVAALTTSQLQTTGLPSGFDPIAWGGGSGGLYPFLTSFFPNGVQAVSDFGFAGFDQASLASGPAGAVTIGLIAGGTKIGEATTGANSYFYIAVPAGTLTNGETLLSYTASGAPGSAHLSTATSAASQSDASVYAGVVIVPTAALTLSTAPTFAQAQAQALAAAGSNGDAQASINGATGLGLQATGASFTIDQPVTTANGFGVQTAIGAPLTVAAPIVVNSGGELALFSRGTLAIDAPITVNGAGGAFLTYDPTSPTNLSFGNGGSLTYNTAAGGPADSGQGGVLTINGQVYTLLYDLAQPGSTGPDTGPDDIAGIDNNTNAGGAAGLYALATNLTGTGSAANPQFASPLAGQGSSAFSGIFEGLGHTITGLTINDPVSGTPTAGPENVGLFGFNIGTVRDLGLVGGSVAGADLANVGALAGNSQGTIIQAYATSAVSGGLDGAVGGLVGANTLGDFPGAIVRSYATGPVAAAGASTSGGNGVGGLVGTNAGIINQSYATGAATGGPNSSIGGLVGANFGSIAQAYATGAVSGSGAVITGGLAGLNAGASPNSGPGGVITSGAFDIQTTGQPFGIGQDQNNQAGNVAALTTSQLQTTGLPSGFDPIAWGGGSGGLYPFLTSFFPNGVQAVSDFAFAGFNQASLASGPAGAVTIGLIAGGTNIGEATTGANGYFYIAAPAGTLTNGETLLSYTVSGAPGSAHLSTATSAAAQSDSAVYAGAVIMPTAALTLSTAPTLAQAQAQALAAAGSNSDAQASINSTRGLGLQATGASFTIDQPVTTANGFGVQTAIGAPLTVAAPIVVNSGGELALFSRGALAIDAPIAVNGAGGAFLAYDPTSPTNLSFGNGAALTYNTAAGGPATSSQGGVLTINGQFYTLLYNLAQPSSTGPDTGLDDIAGIDANSNAGGDSGRYALATNLAGTGTAASPQFASALAGAGSNSFTGGFEGLGHTISNLTIGDASDKGAGLFGVVNTSGYVRDIGLVGGSVSYTASASNAILGYVGQLVGKNSGAIIDSYATGTVNGANSASGPTNEITAIGGLVGINAAGAITGSYATGAVTGAGSLGDGLRVGGLAGEAYDGPISNSYATGAVTATGASTAFVSDAVSGFVRTGGLVGTNEGPISDSYATGSVTGFGPDVRAGGLVGSNTPSGDAGVPAPLISGSYATGAVTGSVGASGLLSVGGLVAASNGSISNSYATGLVTASAPSGATIYVGGLVGDNDGSPAGGAAAISVADSYATGVVNAAGAPGAVVGGLVGNNALGATIVQAYATGAVAGGVGSTIGGLIGLNDATSTITAGAFDSLTTGHTVGIGSDSNGQSGNVMALTTTQLQTGGLAVIGFDPMVWGGGSGGLYPFLTSFFPNGLQAVSGFAYSSAGLAPLASGAAGAVTVGVLGGGGSVGAAFTGANGYYYITAPAGTLTGGESLLAYLPTGGPGATYVPATGATAQSGINFYGGAVTVPTSATTLSTAPTQAQAMALALAAAGANSVAQAAVTSATGLGLIATGAGFTVDQPVSTATTLAVQTQTGAPLTLANPVVLNPGGALGLISGGTLTINAPITVNGAAGVNLAYDTTSPTNLSLNGVAVTYNTAAGGPATSSQGGVLTINGRSYTLLYNLAQPGSTGPDTGLDDIAGIDANANAGGDSGFYALAINLAGTGTAANPQFTGSLAGAGSNSFAGAFEGLGHTITNLTISDAVITDNVGLFGTSSGTIRDIGLVGGVVSAAVANYVSSPFNPATQPTYVGGLVGQSGAGGVIAFASSSAAVNTLPNADTYGAVGGLVGFNAAGSTITTAYSTGPVDGGNEVGGLVGRNRGDISQSFASGAVTGGDQSSIGGLVGNNQGVIDQAYAAGAVSGAGVVITGGLVGLNIGPSPNGGPGGTIVSGAFDTLTTGQPLGIGQDQNNQSGNIAALTTTQLQTGGLPAGFDPIVWGGGAQGLYPYLTPFFPNGVQAVSGVAYSDAGTTPLPSGAGNAVIVQLLAGGAPVGTAATGANGYYYILAPAGTFSAGELLQATIISGGPAESGFFTPTMPFVAQPGVNIYGTPGQGFILPTQGSANLATPTTAGMLTGATLAGGAVTPGPVGYVSNGSVAIVTLTGPRTLIDWTTFEVGNGATLNFNFTSSANDIVLNRLAAGGIAVDPGGAVNGFYGGQLGGNIWFLASNGVLINGAVTAGGVLATNNTAVADLNLLSDATTTLKGELAAMGSLIDFAGSASVAGASIDSSGAILLTGAIDTGPAGAVNLVSTGTITQGGGAITTGTLTGSSVGGTTLAGTNQIAAIGAFTNAGGGGFSLTDAVPLAIAAGTTLDAGSGPLTLVDTSSGVATGAGSVLRAGQDVNLSVYGGAATIGGVVTAVRDINIVAATFSDPQGALTAPGALTLSLSDPNGVVLTGAPSTGSGSDIVVSNLLSPNVAIYEITTAAPTGGIAISTVTLPSVISSLGLYTGGLVDVTGAFLPGAANVALTIGGGTPTPTEIRVQNAIGSGSAGGAIGSPAAPFGLLSLTASGDILLGSPAFDGAGEQIPVTTPASAVNPLTPSPNPPFTPAIANRTDGAIFLDVVNLTVAAGGRVLQQNTAGLLGPADSGVLIGGDLILNPYNGAGPQNFDLFAMFANPTVTGAAAAESNRIILNAQPAAPGQSLYRIDGCVIQSTNACAATAEADAAAASAVDGPMSGKPVPAVAPMQALPVFLLTQPEAGDISDTSVIGATNEEIWRKPDGRKP